MNGVSSFEEFLTDLLRCFITDPRIVPYLKMRLSRILSNLKTQATQGVDRYVTKYLIPELSRLIQSSCGVSAERQMMSLKPFIVLGLESFLQKGRVLNKNEIIQLAKKSIPQLMVETAVHNASQNTKKTVDKVVEIVIKMFSDRGLMLSPTQSHEKFVVKDLKNVLCQAVMPELKEQLISRLEKILDYVENEPAIKDNPNSFMKLLVQGLTPYFPTEFLQCLESTFEHAVKTLKRSSRTILRQTAKFNKHHPVASKIQEASSFISSNNLHHFEDFLAELLRCFSKDLGDELKNELTAILSNLKTLATQGIDRYVTMYLIPELSRLIKSTCGVSAVRQMISLKPFIVIGLQSFLRKGRVLNKDEIIQLAKKSIPQKLRLILRSQLILETAIPNASENTKKKVEKVVAVITKMFFDHRLSPTQSFKEFVMKDLKNVLCQAVMPQLKEQLIRGLEKILDYVEKYPAIKDNPTSFMELLVEVLTPYFPTEFLQCLESTFESTAKTLKRFSRKILRQTASKTADRVASKIQEASSCISSNNLHHFEDFLAELLRCFSKDLVDEIKNELTAILSSLKTLATQEVDKYVTNYLIPELSRVIKSTCGVPVEKQLMSLKTFIIKGLETFLQKGRVPNKDEIIQQAKKSFPDLIIETAIPNASENTKRIVRNALHLVQEAVFNSGTTPSVEKLLQVFHEKCKAFCIDREKLSEAIDQLIEWMPEKVNKITEFLVKHVLPALSVCFEATAFALVTVFLKECFEKLCKEGTVKQIKGRDLAKPLVTNALNLASKKMLKNTAEEVSTVVTKTMVKRKVTHKIVQKYVIDKAGGKMAVETTKKVAAKTSKKVVEKVTQNAGSKAASTASQVTVKQSVKVGTKAVQGQGVQVASVKAVQKASAKVTKNIGEGITNGVTEVTKKTAVKKTVKSTLTETAESVTATTTTKVTKKSVSKATHVSQTSTKATAEAGMKNAAKAGVTAAGISAVVGGVFLYRDLKELDKKKEEGDITEKEYKEQRVERIGEYAGDVIGSGVVGAAVSVAALTGPAGWAAIGVGALVSYGAGKLGGQIAKALA